METKTIVDKKDSINFLWKNIFSEAAINAEYVENIYFEKIEK